MKISMVRFLTQLCALTVGLGLLQSSQAFVLIGPPPAGGSDPDGYQQPEIAYFLQGDIGGPKNLGEEYRWNTPNLFYAFDSIFLDYFGSNGVVAVEQAITVLNGVSNLSAYTPDLYELPLESTRENYLAQALSLVDLKSWAMSMIVEELGLLDPDRFTWCLRDRRPLPNQQCPFMHYDVIKRNFDPATFEPTSYVNGTLLSYSIFEICTGDNPLADALEFPVDPLAFTRTAVATGIFRFGSFYTDLTRDDVGGFRYLMRTNNMNWEAVSTDSTQIYTNRNSFQLLFTSNLALLANQALTNSAGALQALYPNLVISDSVAFFTNVVTTNVSAYFTNLPWSPYGSPPTLVYVTTKTTNVATYYKHTFANVLTNTYYTQGRITRQTTRVENCLYAPPGVLCTNVTSQSVLLTNIVMGDYFILPTDSCGVSIVATQLTTVTATTNLIVQATNTITDPTNGAGFQFSESVVTYFTNKVFVINPVECLTDTIALRQGMDKFRFIRANYDSLLGRFFQPITNRYSLMAVTNSTPVLQTFERVVVRPDFLFSAEERMTPDEAWHGVGFRTTPSYNTDNILNPASVAGPGTMQAPITIDFNKVGPLLVNQGPDFLDEASAITNFVWGSFDGSTNPPVIYPSGASIVNLENQVLIHISTVTTFTNTTLMTGTEVFDAGTTLPAGTVNEAYPRPHAPRPESYPVAVALTATGGTPPYNWDRAPGSPGLPPGLHLNPDGTIVGTPAPGSAGFTYDIVVRLTDSAARYVDKPYAITIGP